MFIYISTIVTTIGEDTSEDLVFTDRYKIERQAQCLYIGGFNLEKEGMNCFCAGIKHGCNGKYINSDDYTLEVVYYI